MQSPCAKLSDRKRGERNEGLMYYNKTPEGILLSSIMWRGYHCMADHLFDWFGYDQTSR